MEIKNTGIKNLTAVLVALPFVFFIVHMLEMVDDPGNQSLQHWFGLTFSTPLLTHSLEGRIKVSHSAALLL